MLQLFVLVEIKFPLAAVLLFLIQLGYQRVHPAGHLLFVSQIGLGQGRLIDKLFQQRFREAALHAANHFLGGVKLGNQFFQRFARQRRRIGVSMQGRTVKSDSDLILIHRFVVFNVLFLFAFLHFVQRRLGNIDVAALDDLRHLTIEEGQQQGTNVRAVDVRIGHDDDAVIAQFVRVVLIAADAAAQSGDQRGHFLGREHFIEAGFLNVEDFTLQRQDRLILAVTPLLRRAARGVPFHQVQFGERRVAFLAVRQFARQASQIQRAFTAGHLTGTTRGFARARGVNNFADHDFRIGRVFQQVFAQQFVHLLLNRRFHLGGDQLVFGLRGEFRIRHFHRYHGNQAFTGVVAGGADFRFFTVALFVHVGVEGTGHRRAEAGKVSTTVTLRNVVGKAVNVFLEAIVPLQGHFHTDTVFFRREIEDIRMDRRFVLVEILNERLDAAFVVEMIFFAVALIAQADRDPGVQERQFAQAFRQDIVFKLGDVGEGFQARPETHHGAGFIGLAGHGQRRLRHTVLIHLFVHFVIALDNQLQLLRQGVNHRDAHAVQTAGNFIGVIIEFTASVQDGHDNFRCGDALFRVNAGRDAAAVILDGDGVIAVDGHHDIFAVTRERFVDSVIHNLEYHVVQTGAVIRVADIHTRALTHRIQPFQDFDTGGVIRIRHQRFSLI